MSLFSSLSSVVVVGASMDPKKIGNIILEKNQNFPGNIYAINPKGGSAYGYIFYPDFQSLPEVPDIAVFVIPESLIYESLESAWQLGIKRVIIITAGFGEAGKHDTEIRLLNRAKKYDIRILWPNCLGYADTTQGLNLSFGGRFFSAGNIGIISQSGAMAVAITDVLESHGLWFSQFYSLGNKIDLDESDILDELDQDSHTEVIALYLESISRGALFLERLRHITPRKPVIVMIWGVSERGKKATASHTGSLSWDRVIYEAAIVQGWAILTYQLSEFFDLLQIFSRSIHVSLAWSPYIITNAWGIGVLSTDQSDFAGLSLADVTPEEDIILRTRMPSMMSTRNPIDIIGDADSDRVLQILTNITKIRNNADILLFFTIQATTDIDIIAQVIVEFVSSHPNYHILVGLIGGETITRACDILKTAHITVLMSTESLIGGYTKLLHYKKGSRPLLIPHVSRSADPIPLLMEQNATERLFTQYHIPTTETYEYATLDAVLHHTTQYQWPYIIKIAWKHIAHKTDIGGVSSRLMTNSEVRESYQTIIKNAQKYLSTEDISGVTIGRYITPSPSFEIFFGAKRDPGFGPIFIIGAGGIYLTVLSDIRLHIGSWGIGEIRSMLESLRSYPAFSGYRHQKSADIDQLIDIIGRLSDMFISHTEIHEIDINPILFENGHAIVADAKVYI